MKKVVKKKKKSSVKYQSDRPNIKHVKVKPETVVHVEMPPSTRPIVVHKDETTVAIIPVPTEKPEDMGWLKYLFGDWTK